MDFRELPLCHIPVTKIFSIGLSRGNVLLELHCITFSLLCILLPFILCSYLKSKGPNTQPICKKEKKKKTKMKKAKRGNLLL